MKVLIITPTFPPISGSHVQRMLKMANVLASCDFKVTVLTAFADESHPRYSTDLIKSIDKRIKVLHAPMGKLHLKAYSTFKNESNAFHNKQGNKSTRTKQIVYNYVQKIKRSVLIPDTMVDWIPAVLKYEKRRTIISKLKPDVIISCSQPSSVHIIGYILAKKYNVPLYMDYADPWTYLGDYNEKSILFKINRHFENKIIKYSLGLSFSAPGCMKLYQNKYRITADKTVTAMSGFEERLFERSVLHNYSSEKVSKDIITLTYGGALHEYVRNPKPFFEASKKFEKYLDVDIRTDNVKIANKWLNECGNSKCINILPYLSFDDYYNEMLEKDVILFFGNNNNIQVPGKIFNCIATGKYILYLKSNDKTRDTVEEILEQYNRSIIVHNTKNEIMNALDYIIKNIAIIRENTEVDMNSIYRFSDKSQYKKIANHLNYLIKEK